MIHPMAALYFFRRRNKINSSAVLIKNRSNRRNCRMFGAIGIQRMGKASVHQQGQAPDDFFRVFLHVSPDPVQHQPDKRIFIKIRNEGLVFFTGLSAFRFFVNNADQQAVGDFIEIPFHLLPADRTVDVHDEDFIFPDCLKDLQKTLLPGTVGLFAFQGLCGILFAGPFNQIIDVPEMIIKGHAADSAVFGYVIDGDLVEGFLKQLSFQRCLQRPLGCLRQIVLPASGFPSCLILYTGFREK